MKNGIASLQLLCGCLISFAIAYSAKKELRIQNVTSVHHDVLIPSKQDILYSKTIMTIHILRETRKITLPSYLPAYNVTLTKEDSQDRNRKKLPVLVEHIYDAQMKELNFYSNEIFPGLYTMKMAFIHGDYSKTAAAFISCCITKDGLIQYFDDASHMKALDRLEFLPYWEEQESSKINFSVSLKYREKNVLHEYTVENGKMWIHMRDNLGRTKSTYLIAFMLPGLVKTSKTLPYRIITDIWHPININFNFAFECIAFVTDRMTRLLDDGILNNTHLRKTRTVSHVIRPGLHEENIGGSHKPCRLIFYNESDVMIQDSGDYMRKINVERLIARKIIANFLGDVSYALNEGLAAYLETYILDKDLDLEEVFNMYVVQDQRDSLYFDSIVLLKPHLSVPYEIRMPYYLPRYIKIPFLLRMLEHLITTDAFLDGIQKYATDHIPKLPNRTYELWNALQDACQLICVNQTTKKTIFNITKDMEVWLKEYSYPLLSLQENGTFRNLFLETAFSQKHVLRLPVSHTAQREAKFSNTSLDKVLFLRFPKPYSHNPYRLPAYPDSWMILNLQQSGYYRVNYDWDNLLKLEVYMNSKNYTNIHVLNRAQIIDDMFFQILIGERYVDLFWNVTNFLSRDTSYVAWFPMFKIFECISSNFAYSTKQVKLMKEKILSLTEGVLKKIGYRDKSGEYKLIPLLRQEAARWACLAGSWDCWREAFNILLEHDEILEKVKPQWKEWVYCNTFRFKPYTNTDLTMYMDMFDSNVVKYRTCTKSLESISQLMEQMARRNRGRKEDRIDYINVFFLTIERQARNNKVLDYILKNLSEIMPPEVSRVAALVFIINNIREKAQYDRMLNFLKHQEKTLLTASVNKLKEIWSDNERRINSSVGGISQF